MTRAELLAAARQRSGRPTDPSDTLLAQMLNETLRDVARRWSWRDLMYEAETALEADTFRYAFPTDMRVCHGIRLIDGTDSHWLHERTARWVDQRYPNPSAESSGRPEQFAPDGNYFLVLPPPDAAYTVHVRYQRWPAELATDAAEPLLTGVDDALVAGTTARVYESVALFEEAKYWHGRYEQAVRKARMADDERPNWSPVPNSVGGAGSREVVGEYWRRADRE